MKVFLSYGHDRFADITLQLKRDLEDAGFDVWIDQHDIKHGSDWETSIEQGIEASDSVVLVMTEHSIRRPDGVCLDEVSYARFLGKTIIPIMVQDVKPPLCIARLQFIDARELGKSDAAYKSCLSAIIEALLNDYLHVEGPIVELSRELHPLDNDSYYDAFSKGFHGRKPVLEQIARWISAPTNKTLWIKGDAGMGKTALVAKLCSASPEVKAVHFCRYNDSDRADAKSAIKSIAYHLSTQIEGYQAILESRVLGGRLGDKPSKRLFEYLIVEPLRMLDQSNSQLTIVIDALDEAFDGQKTSWRKYCPERHLALPIGCVSS